MYRSLVGADPLRRATTYSRVLSMRHVYTLWLALVGNPTICFSTTTSSTLYREPRRLSLRVGTGDLRQIARGPCHCPYSLGSWFVVSIQPHMSSISDVARLVGIQPQSAVLCRWRRRRSAVGVSHARLHLNSGLTRGTRRQAFLWNSAGALGRFGNLSHLFRHDIALGFPDHLSIKCLSITQSTLRRVET